VDNFCLIKCEYILSKDLMKRCNCPNFQRKYIHSSTENPRVFLTRKSSANYKKEPREFSKEKKKKEIQGKDLVKNI
jgi:hypothetical protein